MLGTDNKNIMKKSIGLIIGILLSAGIANSQNDAIIRLDNYYVMYSGIDNPITVAAPGVDTKNLTVSLIEGTGIIMKGEKSGSFMVRPSGNEKTVKLAIESKVKGKSKQLAVYEYFVRQIPAPILKLGGYENESQIDRKAIFEDLPLVAQMNPDFPFKIDKKSLRIIKMNVIVDDRAFVIPTNRLKHEVFMSVQRAKEGAQMTIWADVMMPDGNIQKVPFTCTIKGSPEKGNPMIDKKGEKLYYEEEEFDENEDED